VFYIMAPAVSDLAAQQHSRARYLIRPTRSLYVGHERNGNAHTIGNYIGRRPVSALPVSAAAAAAATAIDQ